MKKINKLDNVRWDLKPFYTSVHDKKITTDVERVKKLCLTLTKAVGYTHMTLPTPP